jgi:Ni,Fe-hydrogenase III small subunit/ferredoxin
MLNAIKVRLSQGRQYITDLRAATLRGFRGLPVVRGDGCEPGCGACVEVCPAAALELAPVRIDLGRCTFCGECAAACASGRIEFTSQHRMASARRDALVVSEVDPGPPPAAVAGALAQLFGRSLKLRSVSAGGCNGCELELNALSNVNFDLGRYGIEFVASPRHADGLVVSGPLTRNMREALELAWTAMPEPKFVIACGACAISGGPYADSAVLDRDFLAGVAPVLHVPGCPPHPLTFIEGILDLLGIELPASPGALGSARRRRFPRWSGFSSATVESRHEAAEKLLSAVGVDLGLGRRDRSR